MKRFLFGKTWFLLFTLLIAYGAEGAAKKPISSSDTIAPTVSVTSPANGATVSGKVQLIASASDNIGVTKVEFYVDGALQGSAAVAPFTISVDATSAPIGAYILTAKAYDAAGNIGVSSPVRVNVSRVSPTPTPTPSPTPIVTPRPTPSPTPTPTATATPTPTPSTTSAAGIIFQENFDSQLDWNTTGSLNADCGLVSCSKAPPNWTQYYSQPAVGNLGVLIQPIPNNGTDHTGGTARKALLAYYNNVTYSGAAELSKTFPAEYQELYLRVWIKAQPGWSTAGDSSIKMFRIGHWDRTGSAFAYFPGGNGAPMTGINWATSSNWRVTNGVPDGCYISWFRMDPQETHYYPTTAPFNVDKAERLVSGVPPSGAGQFADGQWHRYDLHVKMNTQSGSTWNANGIYEFKYDGRVVVSYNNVLYKNAGSPVDLGWNTIQMGGNNLNEYIGGINPQWAAYDDIVVSTSPIPESYIPR